jgi:hypothetical protein
MFVKAGFDPCFPSYKEVLFRTARSRQGRAEPLRAPGRSERIEEEGKQMLDFEVVLKRGKRDGCALCVNHDSI